MTVTKVGIIVSANSKMIRRVIIPDLNDDELAQGHVGTGEHMLLANLSDLPTPASVASFVATQTGTAPLNPRCAVVHVAPNAISGTVVDVIHADPAVDSISGRLLISHPSVAVGWNWSSTAGLTAPTSV